MDKSNIDNDTDPGSGLPIISIYGSTDAQRHPSAQQLAGLDAVVIDLQDVGVRYWTFQALMQYFLEASVQNHIEVIVLDRPNPVNLGVAKDQRLSLNPSQISGACGRLMCCLRYEHDFYVQTRKRFPKEGRIVVTSLGEEFVS